MFRLWKKCAALTLVAWALAFGSVRVSTQWMKYRAAGVPRTADGHLNRSAPAPRTRDGKPDFTGMWITATPMFDFCKSNSDPDTVACGPELPMSREGVNIGVNLSGGLPYQPWLAALVKERSSNNAKDDPHVRCLPDTFLRAYGLPHLLKFVQTPDLLVMLNEWNAGYRQIFLDGRPLPTDPNPSWQGYSSATWSGDTLVVNTNGFRDDIWIDWNGSMVTSAGKVTEKIRRPTFGNLEIDVTVDDPKAYTRPWTVTLKQKYAVDTELTDEICVENEKSSQRMK